MEGGRERDHLVTLKVMRLTKPSLMMTQPISCSPRDLPRTTFNDVMHRDLAGVQGLEHFALGELLTLPQNFGNIFLGETFSSYISVHNDSGQTCKEILVKADLQTRSQRLQLSGANAQVVPELAPGQSIDDVIHHEVKELDTHILVCAVSYTTQSGEKMYFRKFFKFQVLKPLDVKTKFYNAVSDEVYLEAQIQNITPGPIYMERVMLDPSPQYTTEQLGSEDSIESKTRVFGSVNYMNPMDIRQYLYCLTPTLETYSDAKQLKDLTSVGKLDIMWKTSMGEKGRLQTSTLQRVPPGHGDIILSVESIPEAVIIEKTFNVTIKVTNCSEVTMDLVLELYNSNKTGLLWCGTSGRQLPKLAANGNVTLDLSILAIRQGLQSVSGLRLTDSFLKRTYEHDDVAQVFIHDDDSQS